MKKQSNALSRKKTDFFRQPFLRGGKNCGFKKNGRGRWRRTAGGGMPAIIRNVDK
jgi:hypothetical protein